MKAEFEIPVYATELIAKLDEMFPHRVPSMNQSEREIFEYSGRRHLIDFLKAVMEEERMEGLDPTEDVIK